MVVLQMRENWEVMLAVKLECLSSEVDVQQRLEVQEEMAQEETMQEVMMLEGMMQVMLAAVLL